MNEWVKSIVGYLLLVNLTMQMLPHKKYEQYVRLFTGFLLIILLLKPILKIRSADKFLESNISAFIEEQEQLERKIGVEWELLQPEPVEEMEEKKPIEIDPVERVEVQSGD